MILFLRAIAAELLVMAALGCVLGMLGPFDTFALPLFSRVALWLAFAIGGYLCFRPMIAAARGLAEHAAVPLPVAIGIACAVGAVPATWLVAWVMEAGAGLPDAAALGERYPYVLLVGVTATVVQLLLFARRDDAGGARPPVPATGPDAIAAPSAGGPSGVPLPGPDAVAPAGAPFLDRLPRALGRDLLCLEMEDHYVRAHTAAGSTLLLMRMRDAVAELAGVEGHRVHRSWWVARAAVTRAEQRDRQTWLVLANGQEVPVARNSVPALRALGWL